MHVQVWTMFPAVLHELDHQAALAAMIATLQSLAEDLTACTAHEDPVLRAAALSDLWQQIGDLEQTRRLLSEGVAGGR